MAIQNNDDQYEVDFDELDFQSSINDSTFDEPTPVAQAHAKKAFGGRKSPRRSTATGSVDEYKAVLLELDSKVTEICSDSELTSEQKTDLIRYASRQAGHPLDNNRIVQILLEHHSRAKYGSSLILINQNQGGQWFEHGESHIVEDLITKGELNIIGGLSGAAKTNFTAMLLSLLLNHDRDPSFLGFRLNRDQVKSVFFIGLDGGRNVYTPIFRNTGLVTEEGAVPNFNFIPNESGWGITSSNLDKLETLLKNAPDSIVVVDSLLAATSGSGIDENSALIAARIMDLKLVCERHGATLIVLAHQKKESTQDFTGADSLRGHSSIPAFAGQIITLNFLDQKSKVNGKAVPDRKSSKRRLVAGHRGTPIDLLVELNFQGGTVTSHGDFHDALFSIQQQEGFEEAIDGAPTIHALMKEWNQSMKLVFDCLMSEETPIDQSQVVELADLGKGTVSKALKRLTEEKFHGMPVVDVIENDKRHYWITDNIKREVNADY